MRGVILIRHAEAGHPEAGTDFDRPLTERGREQAAAQGRWLRDRDVACARVLASPARRTRETAEHFGLTITHPIAGIYEASPGELLRVLESHADADTVALIGHNPGLSGLAGYLTGRRLHLKPGTVLGIRFGVPTEAAPPPGGGEVRFFRHPRDLA